MVRVLSFGLAATCLLGCATMGPRIAGPPLERGTVIGAGFNIDCHSPGDGTVYLVDAETGKCLYSRTVDEGDKVDIDEAELDTMADMGLDIKSMNPVLYFVPAEPANETQ
jgi:hypothetical protein